MPYIYAANPAMGQFPDVVNIACTMALNGGLIEGSAPFYEAVVSNFAVVMGALMASGIIVPLAAPAPAPQSPPTEVQPWPISA